MQVTRSAHAVYRLQYHVVWVCKYRRKVLNPGVCGYLRKVFPQLLRSMPGVEIETIGFDKDHLHMVMVIPPKYSIASVGDGKSPGPAEEPIGIPTESEVQMVEEGVLEGEHCVVDGLLRE